MTEEKAPATIRKRLLVMVGIIALVSGGVWQYPNIKRTVKNAILNRKIEAAYQDYMAAHPDPCDNMFLAYEAAKEFASQWHQKHGRIRRSIKPEFSDWKEHYYITNFAKLSEYGPYAQQLFDYKNKTYLYGYKGNCTHEFITSMNVNSGDDLMGGPIKVIIAFEKGDWKGISVNYYTKESK